MLHDRSILLTGAGGFLGGVIMAHLKQLGARVIGTIRSPSDENRKDLIAVDLEDPLAIKTLDTGSPYDAVIHCAAALPGKRPESEVLIANLRMTEHLVAWAAQRRVSMFLFASGCNVYGYKNEPCTESTLPSPASRYAISKLACEHLVALETAAEGIRSCILRISAPYGPHLRAETVVERFIRQAARNEPITLLGSGSRSQDFVYEDDIARAFALALSCGAVGTFNISGDRPVSMLELARTVLGIFGADPAKAIHVSGFDPQEAFRGHFPAEAARKAFGYRAQVALEEGLRRMVHAWGEV